MTNLNSEAEQSIIAGIFIRPNVLKEIDISVDEFNDPKNKILYEILLEMFFGGTAIDYNTVFSELEKQGKLDKAGGKKYLFDISDATSTSAGIGYHVDTVRRSNIKNTLLDLCGRIENDLRAKISPEEIVNSSMAILHELGDGNLSGLTFSKKIWEWVSSTTGYFYVTECDKNLNIVTQRDKTNRRQVLHRLLKEEKIEKHGSKNGCFRKIENDFEVVNLDDIDEGELFDITLPFGVQKYIDVMPKDLIIFAGVTNVGKTAVMLDTCRVNMRRHACWYFSSEMGKRNCKMRLAKHETCKSWPFKFIDDFSNFEDIIQPNDLNFIDYLEETEGEAYRIPGMLAKIQRKLKNGIAIVALQKNPNTKSLTVDYAVGGHQTKSKAALFITVDPDYPGAIMRIVKAKNYKDENPNGYMIRFKIVQGINLIPQGIWQPEM